MLSAKAAAVVSSAGTTSTLLVSKPEPILGRPTLLHVVGTHLGLGSVELPGAHDRIRCGRRAADGEKAGEKQAGQTGRYRWAPAVIACWWLCAPRAKRWRSRRAGQASAAGGQGPTRVSGRALPWKTSTCSRALATVGSGRDRRSARRSTAEPELSLARRVQCGRAPDQMDCSVAAIHNSAAVTRCTWRGWRIPSFQMQCAVATLADRRRAMITRMCPLRAQDPGLESRPCVISTDAHWQASSRSLVDPGLLVRLLHIRLHATNRHRDRRRADDAGPRS
jgi:hypothetical protein